MWGVKRATAVFLGLLDHHIDTSQLGRIRPPHWQSLDLIEDPGPDTEKPVSGQFIINIVQDEVQGYIHKIGAGS